MTLIFCATAAVTGGALVFAAYLLTLRRSALHAFLRLEAELDRRYNLGLKLIRATQEHLPHDDTVLVALIDARGMATQTALAAFLEPERPTLVTQLTQADANYGQALSDYAEHLRSHAVAQDPEVTKLLRALAATPERVHPAETAYNAAARAYNAIRTTMPTMVAEQALPAHLPPFRFRTAPLRVLGPVPVAVAA